MGTSYSREVYRRIHHGRATAAVIKNMLMIIILKWPLAFRLSARIYNTAHIYALITGPNRKRINYCYACTSCVLPECADPTRELHRLSTTPRCMLLHRPRPAAVAAPQKAFKRECCSRYLCMNAGVYGHLELQYLVNIYLDSCLGLLTASYFSIATYP